MYIESWIKDECPKCNNINWVCIGNQYDVTGVDLDGYKCFACAKIVFFDDAFQEDEGLFTEGKAKPC